MITIKKPVGSFFAAMIVLLLTALPGGVKGSASPDIHPKAVEPKRVAKITVQDAYGPATLHFEANLGQTDKTIQYLSRGPGYRLYLTTNEAVLALKNNRDKRSALTRSSLKPQTQDKTGTSVLRMKFSGANPKTRLSGEKKSAARVNYFIGNDPKKWRRGVPVFDRVAYEDVYPGIDLVFYGNQRRLEYDFIVEPGADPGVISLDFKGAASIALDDEGNLKIVLPDGGTVIQPAPSIYQEVEGSRKMVQGRYVLTGKASLGFEIASYNPARPLIIDPVLVYSTYLGGSGADAGYGIAVDAIGAAYITGFTDSVDFPINNPFQEGHSEGTNPDVFVTKLNPSGTAIVYSTYLGGTGSDRGHDLAVDATGAVYIIGGTDSTDFPLSNPFQASFGGKGSSDHGDAFVTKLDPTGSDLIFSSFLGGGEGDCGYGIALDSSGSAYITGETTSTDFPLTTNPVQGAFGGGESQSDAFAAKIHSSGSTLVYSTYLGGSEDESGRGIAVDSSGSAYITGCTSSTNFPLTSPIFDSIIGDLSDAFVTKINPSGSALVYSTYLGGSNIDEGYSIALDPLHNAYITGLTYSSDFPLLNPIQDSNNGWADIFVVKLNSFGTALDYSTYLGGPVSDEGYGLTVDTAGSAYITGRSKGDFPLSNPVLSTSGDAEWTIIAAKLAPSGSTLVYSTYLGGSGRGTSIASDVAGAAYVTGETDTADFELSSTPVQGTYGGAFDAFVTKLNLVPESNSPEAKAGPDQIKEEGSTITLDGSGSSDPNDEIHAYQWTQTGGTLVTLSDPHAVQPTFVTPHVDGSGAVLDFLLTVFDEEGLSDTDTVSVTVEDNAIADFPSDTLPVTCSTARNVGIKVDSGGDLVRLELQSQDSVSDTANAPENLLYGLISMQLLVDSPDGMVKITFHLDAPAPEGYKWYKYSPVKGWYDFTDHVDFNASRDTITLTLVDGGPGDDGVKDGKIIDPSGLGLPPEDPDTGGNGNGTSPPPASGGGGGGGCFIGSLN